eukprot:TRINITY_DN1064_c0_g1_i2.p2 TRINITY_DN1064_c0_g1~~TRINITY_DN1064_c0_g1_i2.p2  ORF type:complete len:142 (+),score=11.73 TRINITY_DN1064_c0_g1_i2:163-588(+)
MRINAVAATAMSPSHPNASSSSGSLSFSSVLALSRLVAKKSSGSASRVILGLSSSLPPNCMARRCRRAAQEKAPVLSRAAGRVSAAAAAGRATKAPCREAGREREVETGWATLLLNSGPGLLCKLVVYRNKIIYVKLYWRK